MRGYSEENGDVVLTMTRDDYNYLLIVLGFATGSGGLRREGVIGLVNRLNQGNPNFTPYETGGAS